MPSVVTIAAVTVTTICASVRYICWQKIAVKSVILPCVLAILTQSAIFTGMEKNTCDIPPPVGTAAIVLVGLGALHDVMFYTSSKNVPNAGYAVTILALVSISSYKSLRSSECNIIYGIWTATLGLAALPISTWRYQKPLTTNTLTTFNPTFPRSLMGF